MAKKITDKCWSCKKTYPSVYEITPLESKILTPRQENLIRFFAYLLSVDDKYVWQEFE